jgi:hypothetical protein
VAVGLPPEQARAATRINLGGARGYVATVDVKELLSDVTLPAGLADHFSAGDDFARSIWASGREPDALTRELEPYSPQMGSTVRMLRLLGFLTAAPSALAPFVHAVVSRRPVDRVFALLLVRGGRWRPARDGRRGLRGEQSALGR